MEALSKERLAAIRERAGKATPGEWRGSEHVDFPSEPGYEVYLAPENGGVFGSGGTVAWADRREDADFIAHARADIPTLLDEVKAQTDKASREELRLSEVRKMVVSRLSFGDAVPDEDLTDDLITFFNIEESEWRQ